MRYKKIIRDYFSFTRREKNAALALCLLILMLLMAPFCTAFLSARHPQENDPVPDALNDGLFPIRTELDGTPEKPGNSVTYRLHDFDPNTTDSAGWTALGASPYVAASVVHYLAKGGRFRSAGDLQKIYHFPDSLYTILEPFVKIPGGEVKESRQTSAYSEAVPEFLPDHFDPDTVCAATWMAMGLDEGTARHVVAYLQKGGHFYKPEDLMKIYGISDTEYQRIATRMVIKMRGAGKTMAAIRSLPDSLMVEINSATVRDLSALGLDTTASAGIIALRESYGGLYSTAQLRYVKGIDGDVLSAVLPHLKADIGLVRKIHLNTADFGQLSKHPYISAGLAHAIIAYRQEHGNFISITEIMRVPGMYASLYEKLKPYLSL